ncbi:hypothetical protein FDZ74_03405 [bacterium]|nr:hypothetical protein [Deltaproteobacteria bacterium]TLN23802.1 MAG: hypothetical protein FDZ74_03405 [bacterium]
MNYDSGIFQKLFATALGEKLWLFLNEAQNVTKMETATTLGKPAVEPLSSELLAHFGEVVREKRIKQMIGHMVKQIMFAKGYIIHTQNSSVSTGGLFSKGTTYILLDKIQENKYRQGYTHGAIELFRFLKGKMEGSLEKQIEDWIDQLILWQTEGLVQGNFNSAPPLKLDFTCNEV